MNTWPPVETPELEPWVLEWRELISAPKWSPGFHVCAMLHAARPCSLTANTHTIIFLKNVQTLGTSVMMHMCNSSTQQPGAGMSPTQSQPKIHKSKTTLRNIMTLREK